MGQIRNYAIPRSLMHRRDIPQGLKIERHEIPGQAIRPVRVRSERGKVRRLVKGKVRAMACEVEEQVTNDDEQKQYQDDRRLGLGRKRGLERRILQDALAQRRLGRVQECDVKSRRIDGWRGWSDDDSR